MSEHNPFATPAETFAPASDGKSVDGSPVATQGRRFGNYIIDYIVVQLLSGVAGFIVGFGTAAANGGQVSDAQLFEIQIMGAIVGIIASLTYYIFMEAAFGATIGKLITGCRVVKAEGGSASFGQIVGRTFARMIPFEPFSFLFGDTTTGWHDTLSGTKVIHIK